MSLKPNSSYRGIPAPPTPLVIEKHKGHLTQWLKVIKEVLERLLGQRGNLEDRAVTIRDLTATGLVDHLNDQPVSVTRPEPGVYPTDPPPPPRDLQIQQIGGADSIAAFEHHLQWTNAYDPDGDIAATQVWCNVGTNSRSGALMVGFVTCPQAWYVHANPDPDEHHYYWIRHVNWAGMYSTWEPSDYQGGYLMSKQDTWDNTLAKLLAGLQGEDYEAAYVGATTYVVGDRVKYECADGVERNYVCVKDEPDLVTTGDFASDANWTKGTGWTIANGVAASDGSQTGTSDLEQEISFTNATDYTVQFTIIGRTAGTITPYVNGTAGTARSAAGTYIETITAGASGYLDLRADADFIGSIDDVRVALASGGEGIVGQDPETYWPRWWKRTGLITQGTINGEETIGMDADLIVSGTINTSRIVLRSEDGKTRLDGDALTVYDDTGQLRVKLGRLT